MKYQEIKKWFEDYLKFKYSHYLKKIEKKDLGNNALFTLELDLPKKSTWYKSENLKKYYLILDVEDIENIDAVYVFLFTTKAMSYLMENQELLKSKKILLINPKSLIEKIYPVPRTIKSNASKDILKKFFNKIKPYLNPLD